MAEGPLPTSWPEWVIVIVWLLAATMPLWLWGISSLTGGWYSG